MHTIKITPEKYWKLQGVKIVRVGFSLNGLIPEHPMRRFMYVVYHNTLHTDSEEFIYRNVSWEAEKMYLKKPRLFGPELSLDYRACVCSFSPPVLTLLRVRQFARVLLSTVKLQPLCKKCDQGMTCLVINSLIWVTIALRHSHLFCISLEKCEGRCKLQKRSLGLCRGCFKARCSEQVATRERK